MAAGEAANALIAKTLYEGWFGFAGPLVKDVAQGGHGHLFLLFYSLAGGISGQR